MSYFIVCITCVIVSWFANSEDDGNKNRFRDIGRAAKSIGGTGEYRRRATETDIQRNRKIRTGMQWRRRLKLEGWREFSWISNMDLRGNINLKHNGGYLKLKSWFFSAKIAAKNQIIWCRMAVLAAKANF